MKPLAIGEVPEELKSRPKAFVAFIGLEPQSNNIHAAIWDAFSNNRGPDRAPLNFIMLPEKHVFPKPKPKHLSYEWYEERGLLKSNWLSKHLRQVPAAAVLFYDLDWDDPGWADKRHDCSARMRALRACRAKPQPFLSMPGVWYEDTDVMYEAQPGATGSSRVRYADLFAPGCKSSYRNCDSALDHFFGPLKDPTEFRGWKEALHPNKAWKWASWW